MREREWEKVRVREGDKKEKIIITIYEFFCGVRKAFGLLGELICQKLSGEGGFP